jgi:amino-acid N-acetyltransferase
MSMQPHAHALRPAPEWRPSSTAFRPAGSVELRRAVPGDVDAVHSLIERHQEDGHLLPRTREDIAARVHRFVVAVQDDGVAGCAELVPLGAHVAEVRSLVVAGELQGLGVGRLLVSALVDEAGRGGYQRLCAFTHAPAFFVRLGFSIAPHLHVPEKVFADCVECPLFRTCGQHAVVLPLDRVEPSRATEPRW